MAAAAAGMTFRLSTQDLIIRSAALAVLQALSDDRGPGFEVEGLVPSIEVPPPEPLSRDETAELEEVLKHYSAFR